MTKKGQLFLLIKSLTKAEKRYFRLSCRLAGDASNYVKLFDVLDAQKEYDEKTIRKKFAKEKFTRQLHVTKNYLQQIILKSLRNYHTRISKDAELKDILRNVEILYHRELYALCHAELKKAQTMAASFEINTAMVEITGWKRKLEQSMHSQHYSRFAELLDEQEKAIGAIRNTNFYWQHAVRTSRATISSGEIEIARAGQKKVRGATLAKAQTLEARVLYYNTAYLSALRNGLQDKARQSLTDLLQVLEQFPHRIEEDPGLYISSANNLVSYLVFSKQYEKAIALIHRSRALYEKAIQQHEKKSLLRQILRTYNIELEIYRDTGSFDKNKAFIEHIGLFIDRHTAKIPADYLLSFWFQLANIHFMQKDFDQSLKWVNRILNTKWRTVRIDLQVHARLLNLMVHLEQDNLFVLRYFVDSTRRFLKKAGQLGSFELTLLNFFSAIGQTPKFEHRDRFRKLLQQLFPSVDDAVGVPDYIDYQGWIGGKIGRNKK